MRVLNLIGTFARIAILNEMAYRVNFFVQVFQSLIGLASALLAILIVYSHTDTLGGWSPEELIALVGIYFLMGGLIHLIIEPGMHRMMEGVRMGTFDFTLTKPEDAQLLVSISEIRIWRLFDVVMGVGVIIVALVRLRAELGLIDLLGFAVALLAGATIIYSFWLFLATCSFWFVKIENILIIFESMYEAGRWPVTIYPQLLRITLTFIVPVAFAVTVPSQALVGRLTGTALLGAVALAVALFILSRLFFRVGIRHYSGASA